ncbi:RNA-binding protein [Candidatus Woesearchaeota archaeon]|nr:RNA-binding protein [Candidatus Woesearchaeota archaeon]MBW3022330.1 RNA-binding protein [Candidatus Woesearchaeota archaeon]
MERLLCSSCKKNVTNDVGSVTFKCPRCGKADITRCKHCREIVARYKCPECGFEGPN